MNKYHFIPFLRMSGWEVSLYRLLLKEFLEVLPEFANMSKASTLLTVSADKPDTAFHHQRNCLAGILKSQRETR